MVRLYYLFDIALYNGVNTVHMLDIRTYTTSYLTRPVGVHGHDYIARHSLHH